jgi:hypothetical protein
MNKNTEQQIFLAADDPKPERESEDIFNFGTYREPEEHFDSMEQWYDRRFIYCKDNETLLLCFLYPYEVDLDRITKPEDLLSWVNHLCGKVWMDTLAIREFIRRVSELKGFRCHLPWWMNWSVSGRLLIH